MAIIYLLRLFHIIKPCVAVQFLASFLYTCVSLRSTLLLFECICRRKIFCILNWDGTFADSRRGILPDHLYLYIQCILVDFSNRYFIRSLQMEPLCYRILRWSIFCFRRNTSMSFYKRVSKSTPTRWSTLPDACIFLEVSIILPDILVLLSSIQMYLFASVELVTQCILHTIYCTN